MRSKLNTFVLTGIIFLLAAGSAKGNCTLGIDSLSTSNSCAANASGTICPHFSGGTAPYTYHWSSGSNSACLTNIPAGSYSVTITDALACTASATATVGQFPALSPTITTNGTLCYGQNNGSAILSYFGGTQPIEFIWSNGVTSLNNDNLQPGTYSVSITDGAGCVTVDSAMVQGPTLPISVISTIIDASCGLSNGSITLTVFGGSPSYSYTWSNGGFARNKSNLAAGSYTQTVTDNNGCTASNTFIVNSAAHFDLTPLVTKPSCYGGNNGIVTVTPTGGTAPYHYSWTTGDTTATISNLAAGSYFVLSTDTLGCNDSLTVQVTQPAKLNVDSFHTGSACYGANNGSAHPYISGGTAPYEYVWAPGGNEFFVDNVSAGVYTLTVTDANGCTATGLTTINQISGTPITESATETDASCANVFDGTITVTTGGGVSPFTYSLNGGPSQQSNLFTGIGGGSYVAQVFDANGCTDTTHVSVNNSYAVSFNQAYIIDDKCYGSSTGLIIAALSGGIPPYSYSINGVTFQASDSFAGLAAGAYIVVGRDSHGCQAFSSDTVYQPWGLGDSLRVTNIPCNNSNNGMVCISLFGGTPPYGISWSNFVSGLTCISGLSTGVYYAMITDAVGCSHIDSATVNQATTLVIDSFSVTNATCNGNDSGSICAYISGGAAPYTYNWSNGPTTRCLTHLVAGTYSVTVTDANGCTATGIATVTQPQPFAVTVWVTNNPPCFGDSGTVVIAVTGGHVPYEYQWSNGWNGFNSSIQLISGGYAVTITDASNCSVTDSIYVTQPPQLVIDSIDTVRATCGSQNGAICVFPTGGTAPYTYNWNNTGSTQCINNLQPGFYFLTLSDANGCTAMGGGTVNQVASLAIDSFSTNAGTCVSGGQVCVYPSGGSQPYTYTWNGRTGSNNHTQCLNSLLPGPYGITVTDANLCTVVGSVILNHTAFFIVDSFDITGTTCGGNTGAMCASLLGGTAPYTYAWSNDSSSLCISSLEASDYSVTVTDANGCTSFALGTVNQISSLIIDSFTSIKATCDSSNGSICVFVSGGNGPYQYYWTSTGDTTQCINNLQPNPYGVIVSDINACTATGFSFVNQATNLKIDSFITSNAPCGGNNGSICAVVSGGVTPYTYAWTNSGSTQCITGLQPRGYGVTVTDANTCTATGSANVNQDTLLVVHSFTYGSIQCFGGSDGSICTHVSGGSGVYVYMWSNAATTQCLSNVAANTYVVTVTDGHGCTVTASGIITQPPALLIDSITHTTACYSDTASACVYVSGGTPTYTYVWSNAEFLSCPAILLPGVNGITVSDQRGCTVSGSLTISQYPQITLQVMAADTNTLPDTVSILLGGGNPPYSVIWGDGQNGNLPGSAGTHIYTTNGVYHESITDANGCVINYLVDAGCSDQCVWPGDANYDGIVDNNDLLPIGLAYDSIGFARNNPTIQFIPQYCQSWADTLLGGVNYKHVDCNGDGFITGDDTSAILLNYSLTHPRGGGILGWKTNAPVLNILMSYDTLSDGQTVVASLLLGDSALPGTNVYGLAFTFNYDALVVDSTSPNIAFDNSWLCSTGDHIDINKQFHVGGQIQTAVTRIDHTTRSGYGSIGTVSMKITTGNINGKDLQYYLMKCFISDLTVIDNYGNVLPFNQGFDSAQVAFSPTGIKPVPGSISSIKVYPNPASEQLNIQSKQLEMEEIELLDLSGKMLIQQYLQAAHQSSINISSLSDGTYIAKIKSGGQEYYSRFVKTK